LFLKSGAPKVACFALQIQTEVVKITESDMVNPFTPSHFNLRNWIYSTVLENAVRIWILHWHRTVTF